jgi:hypothetical protein
MGLALFALAAAANVQTEQDEKPGQKTGEAQPMGKAR